MVSLRHVYPSIRTNRADFPTGTPFRFPLKKTLLCTNILTIFVKILVHIGEKVEIY